MSTGANCIFFEETPGNWFYKLQRYPYGENEEYDRFGPFKIFEDARQHLSDHHANPGGYTVNALPGCPHDLLEKIQHAMGPPFYCQRCGCNLTQSEADDLAKPARKFQAQLKQWMTGETRTVEVESKLARDAWNLAAGLADKTKCEGVDRLFEVLPGGKKRNLKPW